MFEGCKLLTKIQLEFINLTSLIVLQHPFYLHTNIHYKRVFIVQIKDLIAISIIHMQKQNK